MDNKIEPIESFVKEGLVARFRKVFNVELTISNALGKREILKKRNQGRALKYPVAFAELSSLALATDRERATPLLRRGIVGQTTSDNMGTFKVPLIPMDSTYQVLFITNDFGQAERYGKLWLMAAASGFMTFNIEYGVVNAGVSFALDPNVNFPQRDSSPEALEEYEVTTSMLIRGYGSHDELVNQQAANTVEMEGLLAAEANKALQQADSPGVVQIFSFKKSWPVGTGPFTS